VRLCGLLVEVDIVTGRAKQVERVSVKAKDEDVRE